MISTHPFCCLVPRCVLHGRLSLNVLTIVLSQEIQTSKTITCFLLSRWKTTYRVCEVSIDWIVSHRLYNQHARKYRLQIMPYSFTDVPRFQGSNQSDYAFVSFSYISVAEQTPLFRATRVYNNCIVRP